MKLGLLLPHFGNHCTHDRVFGQARWIEKAGFNSVWVRDHLTFRPHKYEGDSTLFLEPFTTLAAIAALTDRLILATATIVTFRHPLVTSQLFGTLSYIAKGNRIIAGVGAGTPRAPFDAVGNPYEKRGRLVEEMIQILRLTWSQDNPSFHGEFYNFDEINIDPRPPADIPIYYGGMTNAAIRRTVKYCDGWLPQQMPYKIFDRMTTYMRELEDQHQKQKPIAISYFPITSIDRDRAKARRRVDIDRLVQRLGEHIKQKKWKGMSASEKELAGMLIVGNPQECVEQLGSFQERGIDEIVFDLRMAFDEWENALELLATDVLPHFS
jgi:alkanesulfonate monooxygenase SsuD/methylene tetrahydromethanopterin reductase-like flavin-dependent oxidoreductase (luciferase family)